MKFVCVLVCMSVAALSAAAPPQQASSSAQSQYTTKYDNINLDEILASPRLVKSYTTCLVNGKPCTPDGLELRKILPDALKTSCIKCNDKQKAGALKVIMKIEKDYPEDWKKLSVKWDPTGEYMKKLKEAIKNGEVTIQN